MSTPLRPKVSTSRGPGTTGTERVVAHHSPSRDAGRRGDHCGPTVVAGRWERQALYRQIIILETRSRAHRSPSRNWARPSPKDQSSRPFATTETIRSVGATSHSASSAWPAARTRPASARRAPLLHDLDDHHAVGPLEPQPGVLGDDVADRVLGDDLVAIPRRRGEHVEHDVLDHVGDPAQLRRAYDRAGRRFEQVACHLLVMKCSHPNFVKT